MPDEPPLPAGASIPQPQTVEEQTAVSLFLTWAADALDWGRKLQERAKTAKATLCGS